MPGPNFCLDCGARITRRQWRGWRGQFCNKCAPRFRASRARRLVIAASAFVFLAFVFGRYLRPPPPPLVIERVASSPLSDRPISAAEATTNNHHGPQLAGGSDSSSATEVADSSNSVKLTTTLSPDGEIYICGARTKKGTPCHRHVHAPGERCYQHKGQPAILPVEKLVVKGK